MKTRITLITSILLASSSLSSWAQGGPGRGPGANSLPPMLAWVFDADRDGALSATEIDGAAAALLKLDSNRDGAIEPSEFCPQGRRPGWGRAAGGCPASMALFDADKDGRISAAEANNAPAALKALDRDKDGRITANGFCPRGGRGGPGWAGRGCPRRAN